MAYKSKLERPFRNSGLRYIPKRNKPEFLVQQRLAAHIRKTYPHVVFFSDFTANADLTEHQAKMNKSVQSDHKMLDLVIFYPSRGYNACIIEIKADGVTVILKTGPNKGKLTSNEHIRAQADTMRKLNRLGYYCNFGTGFDQCRRIVDWYMCNENASLF